MWRNFSTWQSVIWKNFSTWQKFSPQTLLVVFVTNIRYDVAFLFKASVGWWLLLQNGWRLWQSYGGSHGYMGFGYRPLCWVIAFTEVLTCAVLPLSNIWAKVDDAQRAFVALKHFSRGVWRVFLAQYGSTSITLLAIVLLSKLKHLVRDNSHCVIHGLTPFFSQEASPIQDDPYDEQPSYKYRYRYKYKLVYLDASVRKHLLSKPIRIAWCWA